MRKARSFRFIRWGILGRPSKAERETIITFNEEDGTAEVFTYSTRWQRILRERCKGKLIIENQYGGQGYEIPKSFIRVPLPNRKASA